MSQTGFPEMYERMLVGPLFRPFAEASLDAVRVCPGDRVLDIACGTGIAARLAQERLGGDGTVVGVDISADMLGVARAVAPNIDWREGSATDLPLRDDERFDVVLCHQGMQFVADRAAAAAGMRRALGRGGRLAVATWRSDDEMPCLRELREVAERHLGPIADRRYSLGEGPALVELLRTAGFGDVRSRTVSRVVRFEDGSIFARLNAMALVGMSGARDRVDKDRRRAADRLARESATVLERYADGSETAFEVSSNLATASG
jgi:ubiquinone/menaquinone biosynthesis C-methylase UbiE